MTTQQITDQRRALAASQALQARIKRENAAYDQRQAYLRGKTLLQIAEEQKNRRQAT